jgi:hypothetical protein
MYYTIKKGKKKCQKKVLDKRHRIWKAMPLLLAKRRVLSRRELEAYKPDSPFRGNQSLAE